VINVAMWRHVQFKFIAPDYIKKKGTPCC